MVVRGDVDAHTADEFSAVLATALDGSPHLVIDMHGVTFFDSSGLGVMADTLHKLRAFGSLTIRHAPRQVTRVFEIAGMDKLLTWEWSTT